MSHLITPVDHITNMCIPLNRGHNTSVHLTAPLHPCYSAYSRYCTPNITHLISSFVASIPCTSHHIIILHVLICTLLYYTINIHNPLILVIVPAPTLYLFIINCLSFSLIIHNLNTVSSCMCVALSSSYFPST
jgi:CBS domain containing-hemolysin-like protein